MSVKTVFVIGAGFSYDAGIPVQGELLKNIIEFDTECTALNTSKVEVLAFIKDVFGLDRARAKNLALEDIYTPLHKSISNGNYLKSYSPEKLKKVENNLSLLISTVIDNGVSDPNRSNTDYVNAFIEKLKSNKRNSPTSDYFSVISLNWDILLDKRLFESIYDEGEVDYACHCTGIDYENRIIPALLASQRGKYIIKLMKLHGSLNWVSCPQCQRLYVNKNAKEGIRAFRGEACCRLCNDVQMNAALLLPSFQKEMGKLHFQSIWNQAGIELKEATKLVFMGYSFPLADFDFRGLITRYVGDVTVDVVLKRRKNQHSDTDTEEGMRYKNYFGSKINQIYYDGVANYIEHHLEI